MPEIRHENITWNEVDRLIDHLLPQFEGEFDVMVIITRGGLIPGGLLAEAMGIQTILTASVDFPAEVERQKTEFPNNELLRAKRCLVVDDVWGSGRTITAVKNRIAAAGGTPLTCVLHFNPHRTLFGSLCPDYYAAITDAYIVYPWEISRGGDKVRLG
jgi:hypoxanthine phosphoribosyltransferase